MRGSMVFALCCTFVLPSAQAGAGCLILKGGAWLETSTPPRARGALVVFEDENRRLRAMRLVEVDLAATEEVNGRGDCRAAVASVFVGTPVRDTTTPVTIAAPAPATHPPRAGEILAAAKSAPGEKAGPPPGLVLDCTMVPCGKVGAVTKTANENVTSVVEAKRPSGAKSR